MKKLLFVALILLGCTSQEPVTFEKYEKACKSLCLDLYKSNIGDVSRVSNAGVTCYCGEQ